MADPAEDQLVDEIASVLRSIAKTYFDEGNGQRLEVVQARAVIGRVRRDLAPLLDAVRDLCDHADKQADADRADRRHLPPQHFATVPVHQLRRALGGTRD